MGAGTEEQLSGLAISAEEPMSRLRELLTELRDAPNENILWDLVKKSGRIEALLAVEARRSAELEPYLQHTQDCQMTTEGHIAAIVSRGDGTVTCTCGLDALRRPSGTGGET